MSSMLSCLHLGPSRVNVMGSKDCAWGETVGGATTKLGKGCGQQARQRFWIFGDHGEVYVESFLGREVCKVLPLLQLLFLLL